MRDRRWLIYVAAGLLGLSAATYVLHYFLFHDAYHIFVFMVGDIAFIPIEVLIVALVIERVLSRHEKRRMMQKLNMVIGTFFSELGTKLLGDLSQCIKDREDIQPRLAVNADWSALDFRKALSVAEELKPEIDVGKVDLPTLRQQLVDHRALLVLLLGNPNLLEHERFTDLLWAIFHLLEELVARESLDGLPETDRKHIAGDIRRVFSLLAAEWVHYCRHLKEAYPYIFSIVVRTHPLQARPDAVVRS
ncbi:MAG: hypothetical protein AB1696_03860 [Planctomycetota bacterium]